MNFPYAPRLDGKQIATGVYNAGNGTTAFVLDIPDPGINRVVLGNDFGAAAGAVLTALPTVLGAVIRVLGQYTSGPCILGRKYDMEMELSRPFRRDDEGKAIIDDRLQLTMLVTDHRKTGTYTVRAEMTNRADRERVKTVPGVEVEEEGQLRAFLNGDTKNTTLHIETDTAKPCTISAVTYEVEVSKRTTQ